MIFGVRPFPETNESWVGYLLRVANKNGLTGVPQLLEALGLKKMKTCRWVYWSDEEMAKIVTAMSVSLEQPPQRLRDFAEPLYKRWQITGERVCADIRTKHPRVCIDCLAEGRQLDWRWQLGIFSCCPHHKQRLVDTCPACHTPVSWHSSLLGECSHCCDTPWVDMKSSNELEASPLEIQVWDDVGSPSAITIALIDDVVNTMFAIARPFDTVSHLFQTLPECSDLSNLISRAYAVLQYQEPRDEWKQQCRVARKPLAVLGDEALLAPMLRLKRELKNCSLELEASDVSFEDENCDELISLMEYSEFIRPARKKLIPSNHHEDARFHVDREQLASLFCITGADFLSAVENRQIKPINSTAIIRDQLFDSRTVLRLVQAFYQTETAVTWTQVTVRDSQLRSHICNFGDLLSALFKHQVKGVTDNGLDLSSVLIEPNSFQEWLIKQREVACEQPISKPLACAALGCGPKKLDMLVKSGSLKIAAWQNGSDQIDGPSLLKHCLLKSNSTSSDAA